MSSFIDPFRHGSAVWLGIALLVSVPSAGCQTMAPKTTTTMAGIPGGPPGGPEPPGPKTEFKGEVGPEQEFNVHLELARFLEAQGNHDAAIIEYQKAADICEKKGSILSHSKISVAQQSLAQRRMAAAYDRIGRFAQAEPHYLKALKLAPGDPKIWNDAGYSYYLQNRLTDAERALKTAESLDANNPRPLTNLGLVLAAEGKEDESLAALTRAGGPAIGHANLGYILAAMGKTEQARHHYQEAIALQPQLAPARQALAKLDNVKAGPLVAAGPAVKPDIAPPSPPVRTAVKPAPVPAARAPVVASIPAPSPRDALVTRTASPPKPSTTIPLPISPASIANPVPVNASQAPAAP